MQTMNTQVYCCAFTCLYNFVFNLFLNLCNDLLDACRVDTTVSYKLMKSQTCNFTSYRVEGADNNSFRGIIDNNLDTSSSFQSTYVSTFTSDYASFDLIIFNMEYTYRVFYCCFSSDTLNCLNNYFLCLLVSIKFGIVHYFINVTLRISFSFILETFNKSAFSLFSTQTAELLKFLTLLHLHLIKLFLFVGQQLFLILNMNLLLLDFSLTPTQFFLTLIKTYLTLLQPVFRLLDMLVTCSNLFLQFRLFIEEFFLYFEKFLLLYDIGFLLCSCYHLVIFSLDDITEHQKANYASNYEGRYGNYCDYHFKLFL